MQRSSGTCGLYYDDPTIVAHPRGTQWPPPGSECPAPLAAIRKSFDYTVFNNDDHQEMHMNLTVTGHHVDVTSSMRNYVTHKMERLQRRTDRVFGVHVILSVEKMRQKAEATIKVAGTKLYADTTEPDMYAAIDLLTDKLDRQLVKHKEKRHTHRRSKESTLEE